MLKKSLVVLAVISLSACAGKKTSPDGPAIDTGAHAHEVAAEGTAPGPGPAVPPPLNPDLLRKIETLRAEGLTLLYSKDPNVKNPKLAFEKLQHAAQLGDPVSMDHVGGFYSVGIAGVAKSCPKALEWYEKSAALGYPMALNNLAYTLVTCPDAKLRDRDRAEELMKTLFANTPGLLAALDTYATILAADGNYKQAVKTLDVVIDLADFTEGNPEKIDEFKQARKQFLRGNPLGKGFGSDIPIGRGQK